MLDAETWEETAAIELDIGRRFFRVKGEDQPLPELGEVRDVSTAAYIYSVDNIRLIIGDFLRTYSKLVKQYIGHGEKVARAAHGERYACPW